MVFCHFLSQVDKGVSHAPQGCIDGNACAVGYFLKAHLQIMSHDEHLFLLDGQFLDKIS